MPLRPFPSPFRVGIDLCEISRIQRLITRQPSRLRGSQHCYLHRFLARVLTDPEEEAFWFRYPSESETEIVQPGHRVSTHLAGRWAAKEAIMKACPRRLTFHDIIIAIRPDKKPYGIVLDHTSERKPLSDHLSPRRRRYLQSQLKNQANGSVEDLSGQIVPLSISHDGEYATAIALYPEESTFDELGGANTRTNLQRSFFISLDKSLDKCATYTP